MLPGAIDKELADILDVYEVSCESDGGKFPHVLQDPFCRADFRFARLAHYLPRVLVAVMFVATGCYVNNLSQAWLQKNMVGYYEGHWIPNPNYTNQSVILSDAGFDALPQLGSTDAIYQLTSIHTTAVVLRFLIFPGPCSLRWTVLTRFSLIWGSLWLLRGLVLFSTRLPNPDFTCKHVTDYPENIWLQAYATLPFHPFVSVSAPQVTCEDTLFSGHTVAFTVNMCFLLHYSYLSPWGRFDVICETCLKYIIGICFILGGYYSIIASHFHYSDDVIVGSVFSLSIYFGYHAMIRLVYLRKVHPASLNFYAFLRWMERDAKDLSLWRRRALDNLRNHHSPDCESGKAFFSDPKLSQRFLDYNWLAVA